MAKRILLTGAGLSANFGAPLASRMSDLIYNDSKIQKNKKLISYAILIMISYFYYGIQEEGYRIKELEEKQRKDDEKEKIQYEIQKNQKQTEEQKRIKLNNILVPLFRKKGFTVRYPLGKWNRVYVEVVLDGTRDGYSTNIYEWYTNLRPHYQHGMNKLSRIKEILNEKVY